MKNKEWTDEEDKILYQHGSKMTIYELHELLPHRSAWAIAHRRANLKIKKDHKLHGIQIPGLSQYVLSKDLHSIYSKTTGKRMVINKHGEVMLVRDDGIRAKFNFHRLIFAYKNGIGYSEIPSEFCFTSDGKIVNKKDMIKKAKDAWISMHRCKRDRFLINRSIRYLTLLNDYDNGVQSAGAEIYSMLNDTRHFCERKLIDGYGIGASYAAFITETAISQVFDRILNGENIISYSSCILGSCYSILRNVRKMQQFNHSKVKMI